MEENHEELRLLLLKKLNPKYSRQHSITTNDADTDGTDHESNLKGNDEDPENPGLTLVDHGLVNDDDNDDDDDNDKSNEENTVLFNDNASIIEEATIPPIGKELHTVQNLYYRQIFLELEFRTGMPNKSILCLTLT